MARTHKKIRQKSHSLKDTADLKRVQQSKYFDQAFVVLQERNCYAPQFKLTSTNCVLGRQINSLSKLGRGFGHEFTPSEIQCARSSFWRDSGQDRQASAPTGPRCMCYRNLLL